MIYPINYNLTLTPDLDQLVFGAKEILTFEIKEPVDTINLDCLDLIIKSCHLIQAKQMRSLRFQTDKSKERLSIYFPIKHSPGIYKLMIEYKGIINDKLAGFYRSTYENQGMVKHLATTQFEATDARRAFPCVDHPSFKATFDITFIVDKNLMVVSNTLPLSKEDLADGKRRVKFDRTPVMSTYLVYFGVGQFETKTVKYKNCIVRGITIPGHAQYTQFALECAQKFLGYFEDYFGVAYPLAKLDLIAVPDFVSGAMENWGAITFRENALLFYPGRSSKSTKQRIAEVVAHELVHQWFGNLVTMKWWDDLWLNESFATYMAYKAMDVFWPQWQVWTDYIEDTYFGGMALDSLESSHPIKVMVKDTHEMNELFDEIAYDKGGSVLRMLDLYLTEAVFQKGLQKDIKRFSYKNAQAEDLWTCLETVAKKPVVKIMEGYVRKIGFPCLSISKNNHEITLTQSRFLFNGRKKTDIWTVPIVMQLSHDMKMRQFIEGINHSFILPPQTEFINCNYHYAGFYISHYEDDMLLRLGENRINLAAYDVIGIVHDLFSLSYGLKIDLSQVLVFINDFFFKEQDPEVLAYLLGRLFRLFLLTNNEQSKYLALLLSRKSLLITGFELKANESIQATHLRNTALRISAFFEEGNVVKFDLDMFRKFLKDQKLVSTDLWPVVFAGAVESDKANYQKVINLYEKAQSQEEKVKFISALGYSRDKTFLQSTLDYSLSPKVRFVNSLYPIASVSANPQGRSLAFSWLVKNWEELVRRTGGHSTTLLRRILKLIIPDGGLGQEQKVKEFLSTHPIAGLERTYKQVLEELEINTRFTKKYSSIRS